jgi:hypothetical protein
MEQQDMYFAFSSGTVLVSLKGRMKWPGDTITTEILAAFSIQFGDKPVQ